MFYYTKQQVYEAKLEENFAKTLKKSFARLLHLTGR